MAEKTLATFRIDPQQWEAFKNLASESGSNASALLLEFVRSTLSSNQISTSPHSSSPTHLDDKIERIDSQLGELRSQMEELRGKLKA